MPRFKTTSAARADISDACSSSTLHPTRHFLWLLQLVTSWSSKPVPTATLPSNRDCACLRSSRASRWDLTRRWLTSLPYWLIAGCRTWDTINPHLYGGIDRKVKGWRQSLQPLLPYAACVCVKDTPQGNYKTKGHLSELKLLKCCSSSSGIWKVNPLLPNPNWQHSMWDPFPADVALIPVILDQRDLPYILIGVVLLVQFIKITFYLFFIIILIFIISIFIQLFFPVWK